MGLFCAQKMIRRAAVAWMTLRRHVEIFAIQSSAPKVSRFQFSGGVIDHLRQRSAAVSRGYAHARMRNRIPPTARKPSESEFESDSSSSDEDDAIDPYAIGEDDGGESDLECLVLDFGAGEEEQKKRSEEQSRSLEEEEEVI